MTKKVLTPSTQYHFTCEECHTTKPSSVYYVSTDTVTKLTTYWYEHGCIKHDREDTIRDCKRVRQDGAELRADMQKQIDDADARVEKGTLSKKVREWGMFPEYVEGSKTDDAAEIKKIHDLWKERWGVDLEEEGAEDGKSDV